MESKAGKQGYCRAVRLFVVLLLFIPAFYFCAGQISYQRAQLLIQQQDYAAAVKLLQDAVGWLPWDSAIPQSLGIAYLALAWQTDGLIQETYYSLAVEQFRKAEQLNPLEPEIAASLACAIETQGKSRPEQILAAYQRAADLAPNSVQYLELLTDKLWQFGRHQEVLAAAESLARIYPGSYFRLRRKPWWTEAAEERFQQGLRQAIAQSSSWAGLEDNDVRRARLALADMMARKGDWTAAAEQQQLALALEQRRNSSNDYFRLAEYYLRCQKHEAAYEAMLTGAAKERPVQACLPKLVPLFQRTDQLAAFPDFYRLLRSKLSFSYNEDIQTAELLIQRKQHEFALELLRNVTAERDYLPKPWQLLAKIYRQQGNTAEMNAAAVKADIRLRRKDALLSD